MQTLAGPHASFGRINVIPFPQHQKVSIAKDRNADNQGSDMSDSEPQTPASGVMGLTEVEPSPVEETPAEFKEDYFPPTSSSSSSSPPPPASRTSTLGLGNHSPAYYLSRVQKYSSYAFTVFASFHIANTSIIPLLTRSVHESNRYLLLTRPYYQSLIAEPLIVGIPLLAHVSSGIALRFYRRRQALTRYGAETQGDRKRIPWPPLSGTSALGYALIPLAGFHVWTTRWLPLYLNGESSMISLSYISHSFARHPIVSFSGFIALVSVGVWHTTWGWARWLGLAPNQVTDTDSKRQLIKKRRWYVINSISALVTGLWLAGGLGIVGRDGPTGGWVGKEYDEILNSLPLLPRWW